MKRVFASLLLGSLWLPASAQAQATDCEFLKSEVARLKAENAFLRKKLPAGSTASTSATSAPAVSQTGQKQTVQQVDITLLRCVGNAKTQTVTVEMLLRNTGPTRALQFEKITAVGASGEEYVTFDIKIGSGGIRNELATNVSVAAKAFIPKVLPSVKTLQVLSCPVYDTNSPGRTVAVEFRNVPITWK